METLADFGTVSYFGVQTFTTGIYRAWLSLGDASAAAQLATCPRSRSSRSCWRWSAGRAAARAFTDVRAADAAGAPARRARRARACRLFRADRLRLPAAGRHSAQLALTDRDAHWGARVNALIGNSFALAGITAVVAVAVALLLAYAARLHATRRRRRRQPRRVARLRDARAR